MEIKLLDKEKYEGYKFTIDEKDKWWIVSYAIWKEIIMDGK